MQARTPPVDRKLMQDMNQNTLLNLIRNHAPISRPHLTAHSGLSPATVMSLTNSVIGVGCALSGYIDAQAGRCVDSWNLDWHHVEISQPLNQRLSLPVFIDNDVSCLTTYEKLFGRCKDCHNFFTVSLGRGVGLG